MDALEGVFANRPAACDEFVHEVRVAAQAAFLEDLTIARLDLDGFVEIHEREPFRVPKPVVGLGDVLRHEIMGQMAVHTASGLVVPALLPGVILIVHHMAVRASTGIGGEIAEALAVIEREKSQAGGGASQNCGNQRQRSKTFPVHHKETQITDI